MNMQPKVALKTPLIILAFSLVSLNNIDAIRGCKKDRTNNRRLSHSTWSSFLSR
jgi:hypothetical protein